MSYKKLILFLVAPFLFLSLSQAVSYKKRLLCAAPFLTFLGVRFLFNTVVKNSIKIKDPHLDQRDLDTQMIFPNRPVAERAKSLWDRYGVFQLIDLDTCLQEIIEEHLHTNGRLKSFTFTKHSVWLEYQNNVEKMFSRNTAPCQTMKQDFPSGLVGVFDDYSKAYRDFQENFKNFQGYKYKIQYKNGFYFSSLRMMAALSEHLCDIDQAIAKLEKLLTQRECKENLLEWEKSPDEIASQYEENAKNQQKHDHDVEIKTIKKNYEEDILSLKNDHDSLLKKKEQEIEYLKRKIEELKDESDELFNLYILERNAIFVWFFDTFGRTEGIKKYEALRKFIYTYTEFRKNNEKEDTVTTDNSWQSIFNIDNQNVLKQERTVEIKISFEGSINQNSSIETLQRHLKNDFENKTIVYDPDFKGLSKDDIIKKDFDNIIYLNKNRLKPLSVDQNQNVDDVKNINQVYMIYRQFIYLFRLLQNSQYNIASVRFTFDDQQGNGVRVEYQYINGVSSQKRESDVRKNEKQMAIGRNN